MRNTGINKKIENLILTDLANLKLALYDANRVWEYRDEHFLNGSYDGFFDEYINKKKLKYDITHVGK